MTDANNTDTPLAPSGAGTPAPGVTATGAQRKPGGKVGARAIHEIVHDKQTIPAGKTFTGDEKDVNPLVASGAAEFWPPKVDAAQKARDDAARKALADRAQANKGVFDLDEETVDHTAEVAVAETPQERQDRLAQEAKESQRASADARAKGPVVDAFGRPVADGSKPVG